MSDKPAIEIVDWNWQPPDHPWNPELAVEEWCGICGQTQICHDGNMEAAFRWMESAP